MSSFIYGYSYSVFSIDMKLLDFLKPRKVEPNVVIPTREVKILPRVTVVGPPRFEYSRTLGPCTYTPLKIIDKVNSDVVSYDATRFTTKKSGIENVSNGSNVSILGDFVSYSDLDGNVNPNVKYISFYPKL